MSIHLPNEKHGHTLANSHNTNKTPTALCADFLYQIPA